METKRFEYDGRVYLRPLQRGVVLLDSDADLQDMLDRLVGASLGSGWEGEMRIVVEAVAEPDPAI